jgi:hypothetical protein
MKLNRQRVAVILIVCMVFAMATAAFPSDMMKLVKLMGIPWLVKENGPAINKFFNKITANKKLATTDATKVVPIVSLGSGGHVGAAQVAGPQKRIDNCKAVLQIEGDWNSFRGTALVPVDEANPTKSPKRVPGVGVSAILEIKL